VEVMRRLLREGGEDEEEIGIWTKEELELFWR